MKKSIKVIGYILVALFVMIGGFILVFSDRVEQLKYKYPLGLGSCLAALALAWILSNSKTKESSKKVFIFVVIFIVAWIVLSMII